MKILHTSDWHLGRSLPDATLSPIIQGFWTEPAAQLAKLAYAESNQALEKLG